jgi:hypothetical protein
MARCTMSVNLMIYLWACRKISAYLENVVKCLPVCKVSGGDIVEMLHIAPPRKHRHSVHNFATFRYLSEEWEV